MKNFIIFISTLCLIVFLGCSKKTTQEDLCEGVICKNGGNCVNGDCNCPPEWTGSDCSQEKPPIKLRVASITITKFPPTSTGGSGWDLFDGPDVFITISKGGTQVYSSGYKEDLTGNSTWNVNYEFTDPQDTYLIEVYDYDDGLSADDYMGGINFTPYRSGQKFPTSYTLDCASCTVSFKFNDVVYSH